LGNGRKLTDLSRSGSASIRIFRPAARPHFQWAAKLPEYYKQFFDPFIGLTAAAAATEELKVGTSVCLVPEHNTMNLAKIVSCLDRVSNGRFLFGMGGDEMAEGSFVRRPDTPNAARAIQKIIEFVHEHAH